MGVERTCPQFCVCSKCSQRIAMEHRAADERCGRDWDTGGCQCGACCETRQVFADIDAAFARVTAAEKALASYRAKRDGRRG